MERGNAKHGSRLDQQHGEDRQNAGPAERRGGKGRAPGVGITPADVERRSALAKWLSDARFPADRDGLVAHARRSGAPDTVVDAVAALPDMQYATVSEVAQALGLGVEPPRRSSR